MKPIVKRVHLSAEHLRLGAFDYSLAIEFTNQRYHQIKIRKVDSPLQVAMALEMLAKAIREDKHLNQ